MKTIYQQKGYNSREDYLQELAVENGVELDMVMALAELLGENEDFDGLITAVEEASWTLGDMEGF